MRLMLRAFPWNSPSFLPARRRQINFQTRGMFSNPTAHLSVKALVSVKFWEEIPLCASYPRNIAPRTG